MEKVLWTEEFSVGVDILDADHKRLLELLNELIESRDLSIFNALVEYAQDHLAREEGLFKASEYPDVDLHVREHDKFLQSLADIHFHILKGVTPALVDRTILFLRNWLLGHILRRDKGYRKYLEP
jgi:hemerythrin-like metal-binding protein